MLFSHKLRVILFQLIFWKFGWSVIFLIIWSLASRKLHCFPSQAKLWHFFSSAKPCLLCSWSHKYFPKVRHTSNDNQGTGYWRRAATRLTRLADPEFSCLGAWRLRYCTLIGYWVHAYCDPKTRSAWKIVDWSWLCINRSWIYRSSQRKGCEKAEQKCPSWYE